MSVTTRHFRLFAILCGLLACAGGSFRVWQLQNQPVGDPWTPAIYAPGLEATTDKLEVLLAGEPLAKAITEQRLTMATSAGAVPVKLSEVKVRLNNEAALRAATVPPMLGFSALAGGGFVLFLIGLLTPMIGAFKQHGLVDIHLTA
jgi:hypothetical protein